MKGLIIKDLKLTARTTTRAMLIVYGLLIIYMGYVSKEGAGLIISVLLGMVIGMSVLTTTRPSGAAITAASSPGPRVTPAGWARPAVIRPMTANSPTSFSVGSLM